MNHIVVVGAGFLGKPVADQLQEKGDKISILTSDLKKFDYFKSNDFNPYLIDWKHQVFKLPKSWKGSTLLVTNPLDNVESWRWFLDLFESDFFKRVIFISTTGVYGSHGKMDESSDRLVGNKRHQIESVFKNKFTNNLTIVRMGGLIGGSRHPGRFFSGKRLFNPVGGVNLIHRWDAVELIQRLIEYPKRIPLINGVSSNHMPRGEFYTKACLNLGVEEPILVDSDQGIIHREIDSIYMRDVYPYGEWVFNNWDLLWKTFV